MEEIREEYKVKNEAMKEKYKDIIYSIADKNGVDLGVAFDMLKAIARGGEYAYEGELNIEELKKEYAEIVELSEKIAQGLGII
ncbi:MAG: hypothetical protein J6T10_24945 [Methanobrevibacter sp.]|nr:hypothetical protein [Methanobrevibacter sp.]